MPTPKGIKVLRRAPREDDCFILFRKGIPVFTMHRVTFALVHKFRVLIHEAHGFPLYDVKRIIACHCRGKLLVGDS